MTTTRSQPIAFDEAKLNAFVGKAVGDWGTLTSAALVVIGDKLGLYTALADGGPATPDELAQRTGTVERYVRPWLINQAAGGYMDYDASSGRFHLPPEHAAALGAAAGAYHLFTAAMAETPAAALRYRPAGEDYALGGLAIHVGQVLEKYASVLEAMRTADSGSVLEPPSPAASDVDAALVRDGFDDLTRAAVLERVRGAHARVVTAVQALPDDAFRRAAPVTFAGTAEPFATSPADVLGWVHDHYSEHIHQVMDLRSAWASTQTSTQIRTA